MSRLENIDPRRLANAITRAEAIELYHTSQDPLEQIEAIRIHEAAAGHKPPTMAPFLDPATNLWTAEVPSSTTGGVQKFRAPTLEGLISVLCTSQWHASNHIRKLNQMLKDKYADDNSCYSVVDAGDFQ